MTKAKERLAKHRWQPARPLAAKGDEETHTVSAGDVLTGVVHSDGQGSLTRIILERTGGRMKSVLALVPAFLLACSGAEPSAPSTPASTVGSHAATSAPADASAKPNTAKPQAAGDDAQYKADLETFCNAPAKAPGASTGSESDRNLAMAKWVDANVKSDRFRKFFQEMSSMAPAARPPKLRGELEAQGIAGCPWLDTIEAKKK